MVLSSAAISAAQLAAQANGAPCFVGKNVLRGSTAAWHIGDRFSGAQLDYQDLAERQVAFAFNQFPNVGSRCLSGYAASVYLYAALSEAADVDTIAINLLYAQQVPTATIYVADNAAMTGRATVGSIAGVPSQSRGLLLASTRYSGVTHVQVKLDVTPSNVSPIVGEIYVGRRRQLARKFSTGFDDHPYGVEHADFKPRSHEITRYALAEGFSDFDGDYDLGGEHVAFDDEAEIRGFFEASNYGANLICFVPNPATATAAFPHRYHLGYCDDSLVTPRKTGAHGREWSFRFREASPFYGHAAGYTR